MRRERFIEENDDAYEVIKVGQGDKGTKEFQEAEESYADSIGEPLCVSCKHTHNNGTCEAFPEGIPLEIVAMEVKHIQPYEGDHGIQYEPKTKAGK